MRYREFEAPESLRQHVRCAWHLQLDASSNHIETVYPDGCCELIAHRGTPVSAFNEATGWLQQERNVFAAQQRTAIRLAARADVDCIGVRLHPAASAMVAGLALPRLCDRIVDLAFLDTEFASDFAHAAAGPAVETSIADIWRLLERHAVSFAIDRRIEKAVQTLEACDGIEPVASVIAGSGMSERAFQTAFKSGVGLNAKEFARIRRLRATIRALDNSADSIARAAADGGYSDQAHATREIRRITGTTPAKLRDALRQDRNADTSIRLAAAFIRGRLN